MFVAGGINVVAAIVYFIMQIIGGIVGAACVLVSTLLRLDLGGGVCVCVCVGGGEDSSATSKLR